MEPRFSFLRVLRLLLVLLSLSLGGLLLAYSYVPGADLIIDKRFNEVAHYLAGTDPYAEQGSVNWQDQLQGPSIQKQRAPEIDTSSPDVHPASFYFEGKQHLIVPQVDMDAYRGALVADRLVYKVKDVADQLVIANYYRSYVFAEAQQSTLDSVTAQLRKIKTDENLDDDRFVELIVKYVQSIPYDTARAALIDSNSTAGTGDPRFPIQVLKDGTGDCDEKVFLLAALLNKEGFSTAALLFNEERHMSLGIKSPDEGYKGTGFEYVETTGVGYVSEVPEALSGGVKLESQPEVILFNAKGKGYSAQSCAEVDYIIAERNRAALRIEELNARLAQLKNNPREYNKLVEPFNNAVEVHNTMNNIVDPSAPEVSKKNFKDRSVALTWLKSHRF